MGVWGPEGIHRSRAEDLTDIGEGSGWGDMGTAGLHLSSE